jgi:hypothetical protein
MYLNNIYISGARRAPKKANLWIDIPTSQHMFQETFLERWMRSGNAFPKEPRHPKIKRSKNTNVNSNRIYCSVQNESIMQSF